MPDTSTIYDVREVREPEGERENLYDDRTALELAQYDALDAWIKATFGRGE